MKEFSLQNSIYNDNLIDKFPVGYERWCYSYNLPLGYTSKNGQTLLRNEYPKLFLFAIKNNFIVTEDDWINKKLYSLFSYGDGKETFRIPDDRGVYYCHFDKTLHTILGQFIPDTLQGHAHNISKNASTIGGGGGAGTILSHGGNWINAHEIVELKGYGQPRVSSITQPRTITALRIIKYR